MEPFKELGVENPSPDNSQYNMFGSLGPGLSALSSSVAYVNANAYTVNTAQPWASGFIVSPDGVFSHVGNGSEILNVARAARMTTINLRGQFVMPGIHDAHIHALPSGMALIGDAAIAPNTTAAQMGAAIKSASCHCEVLNAYQDWIFADTFDSANFPNGQPDRKYLDTQFPDTPVIVVGGAGHSRLLNTKALELAGYDLKNEPDVQGGKFFRREDGTLTGEVADMSFNKGSLAYTQPTMDVTKRALLKSIGIAHSVGVTSYQEATANTPILNALRELEADNQLKMNIFPHIVYKSEWAATESEASLNNLIATARSYNSKHIESRFVKIILDGVPLPPILTHSTLDANGTINMQNIQVPDIMDAIKRFDEMGLTVKIHATGDGGIRLALNAIEAVRKSNPNGPPHEVAHNNMVHPDDYKRYRPLKAVAEMSPAFLFPTPPNPNTTFGWKEMLDNNVHMTIGSDWGAGPNPNLMGPLAFIVEQIGRGSKTAGGEALVRMITLGAAEHLGKDKEVGSIEVGKKANFIVVDKDLSKGEFAGAVVQQTYFEGELVYDKN